jgi:hypothetical protein
VSGHYRQAVDGRRAPTFEENVSVLSALTRRDACSVTPSFDGFHASALYPAAHGPLHSGEGAIDCIPEGGGLTLEYHARKAA